MNGIFGLWHRHGGTLSPGAIEPLRVAAADFFKGKNHVLAEGSVAFGAAHVHQNPTENSLWRSSHGVWVAADARLKNREDLCQQLLRRRRHPSDVTNAEIIATAYQKWGSSFPAHLSGRFAIALWDGPNRRLLCVRDQMGLRPLYYYSCATYCCFSSRLQGLLALPFVDGTINDHRVADYIVGYHGDKSATFYQDIYRVVPATICVFDTTAAHSTTYWALQDVAQPNEGTTAENDQQLRARFLRSIEGSISKKQNVGTMLSGGLDSSLVTISTARAKGASPENRHPTFSLIFDEVGSSDEREFIHAVLENGIYSPYFVHGDEEPIFGFMDEVLRALEEPPHATNLFLHWALFRKASEASVPVLLDGFLGDNVIGHGDRYLTDLALSFRWLEFMRQVNGVLKEYDGGVRQAYKLLQMYAIKPLITPVKQRLKRLASSNTPLPYITKGPLNEEFARALDWPKQAYAERRVSSVPPRSEKEAHLRDITSGNITLALETAVKAAMGLGVDLRFPFADKALMEFCVQVPAFQRCDQGLTRLNVRRAFSDFMPEKISNRTSKANLRPVSIQAVQHAVNDTANESCELSLHSMRYLETGTLGQLKHQLIDTNKARNTFDTFFRIKYIDLFLRNHYL